MTTLTTLPPELLLHVQSYFDTLQDHVFFSQIHPRTRHIYTGQTWKILCISCGLGRPKRKLSWRHIAACCVVHSKVCRLKSCQVIRTIQTKKITNTNSSSSFFFESAKDVASRVAHDDAGRDHIADHLKDIVAYVGRTIEWRVLVGGHLGYERLRDHPSTFCQVIAPNRPKQWTFAFSGFGQVKCRNEDGVTVSETADALDKYLLSPLTDQQLISYIKVTEGDDFDDRKGQLRLKIAIREYQFGGSPTVAEAICLSKLDHIFPVGLSKGSTTTIITSDSKRRR